MQTYPIVVTCFREAILKTIFRGKSNAFFLFVSPDASKRLLIFLLDNNNLICIFCEQKCSHIFKINTHSHRVEEVGSALTALERLEDTEKKKKSISHLDRWLKVSMIMVLNFPALQNKNWRTLYLFYSGQVLPIQLLQFFEHHEVHHIQQKVEFTFEMRSSWLAR